MQRSHRLSLLCAALLCATAAVAPASAQDSDAGPESTGQESEARAQSTSPFGIGFQGSWPAYGLSALYDVNDRITAQAVLGALGTVTAIAGRLLYDFQEEPKYDLYGFGTVGLWHWSGAGILIDESETSVGFGGGAGIELDWQNIISEEDGSFPPLFSSIDLGLTIASFDRYNWSAVTLGAGLHYRF